MIWSWGAQASPPAAGGVSPPAQANTFALPNADRGGATGRTLSGFASIRVIRGQLPIGFAFPPFAKFEIVSSSADYLVSPGR